MAQFFINTRVFFGKDTDLSVSKYLKNLGLKNINFIVDKNIKNLDIFLKLVSNYRKHGFNINSIETFSVLREPTYDDLDEFTARFRKKKIELIIAIGGGSVLDIAKGVGILLKNPGKAIEYRGMDKVSRPPVPVVCYPSTAGTGSEVTNTASFIDINSKTKLGINGKNVSALFSVLVPELSFSCPVKVTISSGLDAMVHAIEAISAKNANKITTMLGCYAFSLLYNKNFQKVIAQPDNYVAREGMLLGSYYAGIAMMNAAGGPASGISYPLGVHFGVPHGLAGGIFLQHIFEYNVAKGYQGYAKVYNYLSDAEQTLDNKKKSLAFVAKFKQLYKVIKAPEKLSDYGVNGSSIEFLTNLTLEQRKVNLELNPVYFPREQVKRLLEKVI